MLKKKRNDKSVGIINLGLSNLGSITNLIIFLKRNEDIDLSIIDYSYNLFNFFAMHYRYFCHKFYNHYYNFFESKFIFRK